MSTLTLRAADADDTEFLLRVYASTRTEELSVAGWNASQLQLFLQSQFAAQDRHYRSHFPAARFDIVQVQGCDAGRLVVDRSANAMHLIDIALLPEYRGRGLGGALLGALLDEARASQRCVVLQVERHNPALALYRRLGFVQVSDSELRLELQWSAPSIAWTPNPPTDHRLLETTP